MPDMKRRDFVALLGGGAVAWPMAVNAQQPAMSVVGLLRSTTAAPFEHVVTAFRNGLSEEGFIEGRNVVIEQRWANNQRDQLPGLAADLVRRQVAVIVCSGIHRQTRHHFPPAVLVSELLLRKPPGIVDVLFGFDRPRVNR